jgi:hypothetical protein
VVGSPTHPVMPNLVMLWKMSPLRGGVRAGARLWARGQRPETHRVAATSNKQQATICRELHARYKLQVASGYKLHLDTRPGPSPGLPRATSYELRGQAAQAAGLGHWGCGLWAAAPGCRYRHREGFIGRRHQNRAGVAARPRLPPMCAFLLSTSTYSI